MLTYLLLKTSRSMKARLDRELQSQGITSSQFAVMNQIALMNNKALAFEIAKAIGSDRPTVSAIIQRLFKTDIIYKEDNDKDRRSQYLCLTTKGIESLEQLRDIADRVSEYIFQDFTQEEQKLLFSQLNKICERAEDKQ